MTRHQHRAVHVALAAIIAAAGSTHAAPTIWKNDAAPRAELADQRAAPIASALAFAAERAVNDPYVIVRLKQTPDRSARSLLNQRGLTLLSPVSADTYFARIDPNIQTNLVADQLRAMSPITRAHKQHPAVAARAFPQWAVKNSDNTRTVALYVKLHDDINAADPAAALPFQNAGAQLRSVIFSVNTLVLELPESRVDAITDIPTVQWAEPPAPPLENHNASNRAASQVDDVNAAPYALTGAGVTVLVYDGGRARTSHNDFSSRAIGIDSAPVSFHATHVAATVAGDGSANSINRGMAPDATILTAGFEQPGGLSQGFLYTDPGDIEADYTTALSLGADIANNSIGSNVAQNGYPCSWQGDYGLTSATIDAIINGSLGEPITVFWSAGNERGPGTCGTFYGTVPPPANNKNAIVVGALNSNDDSMTSFSSWGPSDDGRLRPVISAPGCQSNGDGGVTSADSISDSAYTTLCGTSMSAPTATGIAALLLQDFRSNFPQWGDPSNQLTKALLVHSSRDILSPGPDYQSGFGLIQAKDAVDHTRTGSFEEAQVDHGATYTFSVLVEPGDPQLKVTLAWDDAPATPNSSTTLVNDLDLVVISPSGTRAYPWTLDQTNPSNPASRTQEDHLNNTEQVLVDTPEPGLWEITVRGTSVPAGPQGFAITATPELAPGLLSLSLLSQSPDLVLPQTPINVQAQIVLGMDTFVDESAVLNYRYDDGPFAQTPMTHQGDGAFTAQIPGADCDQRIEYYIQAQGDQAGTVFAPPAGASSPITVQIGERVVSLTDTLETDNGWTTSSNATSGAWQRGIPVNCAERGAPPSDSDGSGQCWLTENVAALDCNSDIDNGTVFLVSPTYDLADGADFTFDYWFGDIPTGPINGDTFSVDVSTNNGATWTRVRTITTAAREWRTDTIAVGDEIPATATMKFRFGADDAGAQNVIEAGVDNIRVSRTQCVNTDPCPADLDGSGALDFGDVSAFLALFAQQDPSIDLDGSGTLDFADVSAYLTIFAQGCP